MISAGLAAPRYRPLAKTERKLPFLRIHFVNHDPVTKLDSGTVSRRAEMNSRRRTKRTSHDTSHLRGRGAVRLVHIYLRKFSTSWYSNRQLDGADNDNGRLHH
jgi:hypothetical protein